MTHSNLLRLFSYLGFRGSRKIPDTNSVIAFSPSSIPVPSHSRIQLVDIWSPHHYYTIRSKKAYSRMGQASSSFVRAYAGADENANESSKEGIDNKDSSKGDEGSENDNSANDASSVNEAKGGDAESEGKQKASVDVFELVERIPEGIVSPEDALTSQVDQKVEKDLVSEKGKPDVKKNAAQNIALNLVVDELGEPPERPLPGDCCGQGCDVCVWDNYNDELRDYLARKKALLKKSK